MFKRCPQKWWWAYQEGLAPKQVKPALWFGTAVHEALAAWYLPGLKRGPHPAETILQILEPMKKIYVANDEDEGTFAEATLLGEQMMNRYVQTYGEDSSWNIIAPEQTFQVWIPHPKRPGRWLRYVGTADGVYIDEETGEVWLLEHKTAAQIKTTHLPLDDQAGSYWAIMNSKLRKMGVLKPGQSIAGIKYNFMRKALDDERPHNHEGLATNKPIKKHYVEALLDHFGQDTPPGEMEAWEKDLPKMKIEELHGLAVVQKLDVFGDVSASQPPPYHERVDVYRSVNQRKKMIERIQSEGLHMEAIKNGTLPLFKTPTRDCDWYCEFFKLCQMHEEGAEYMDDYKESEFMTRDPYADHRKKSTDS